MAFSIIDVTTPAGSDKKKFGDDKIRELKTQVVANLGAISGYPNNVAVKHATWTTENRPSANLTAGLTGYNTTTGSMDVYTGSEWDSEISKINDRINYYLPKGLIAAWSGAYADIPEGWGLCDGSTYDTVVSPNLISKFIMGGGPTGEVKGKTGGAVDVTLTEAQMPSHTHAVHALTNSNVGAGLLLAEATGDTWQQRSNVVLGSTGGGTAHENLPPYYVLAYIIKIV